MEPDGCCQSDCTRSTSIDCTRTKKQIDAAFTDSNGKLYLFQDAQFAVYSNLNNGDSIGSPDIGYPKYISDSFPISAWSGHFDAAFCSSDDIVYIFKDFSYVRVDLGAIHIDTGNAQIDASPIPIETKSSTFEFGYIPKEFGECGAVDAAFVHSSDQVTIVCGSIYYSWTIGSSGWENVYRPLFVDYPIEFGDFYRSYNNIDAASYNWTEQTLRFYAADVYVDYGNGQQNGNEIKLQAMGHWTDNANCGADNCGNCDVQHNGKCYDASYLMVVQFESFDFDEAHFDSHSYVEYAANGGVFSGSNAMVFIMDSKVSLSVPSSMYSVITHWKLSLWLYPESNTAEQYVFCIINNDKSQIQLTLNPNSKCSDDAEGVTVSVIHAKENGEELTIFGDDDCTVPLSMNMWNKVTLDISPYLSAVTVNSKVEPSKVFETEIDLSIDLESWYFGTTFIGKIDYFVFQETDGYIVYVDPTEPPSVNAACLFPVETAIHF